MNYDKLKSGAKECGVPVSLILFLSGCSKSSATYWKNGGKMKESTAKRIEAVMRNYQKLYNKMKERLENGKKN